MARGPTQRSVDRGVLAGALCPACRAPIDLFAADLACEHCRETFPRVGRIPLLLPRPHAHLELWRNQLALVIAHGRQAQDVLEEQARGPGHSPRARARLEAMAEGVRAQREEIVDLVGPSLGGPGAGAAAGLPRGIVEYGYYLHRDWAWDEGKSSENEGSVDSIRAVIGARKLGRTIVLGAGGCRPAYDLHRRLGATGNVAIDIEPYLFVTAQTAATA